MSQNRGGVTTSNDKRNLILHQMVAAAGAGATEATQLLILAELAKDFDFEVKCVRDITTGIIYLMRMQKDETDDTITIDYVDATGTVVIPPVPGDLRVCDTTAILTSILTELELKADLTETQPVSLATTARTQAIARRTDTTGSPIAAGARSITVFNAGAADGDILGGTNNIKPGESFSFVAGGEEDTLAAFAYDGTGTELVIITIV